MNTSSNTRHIGFFIMGLGFGAGLMFFLDPIGGRRRRALINDQFVHAGHVTKERSGKLIRHFGNKARGIYFETRKRVVPHESGTMAKAV